MPRKGWMDDIGMKQRGIKDEKKEKSKSPAGRGGIRIECPRLAVENPSLPGYFRLSIRTIWPSDSRSDLLSGWGFMGPYGCVGKKSKYCGWYGYLSVVAGSATGTRSNGITAGILANSHFGTLRTLSYQVRGRRIILLQMIHWLLSLFSLVLRYHAFP